MTAVWAGTLGMSRCLGRLGAYSVNWLTEHLKLTVILQYLTSTFSVLCSSGYTVSLPGDGIGHVNNDLYTYSRTHRWELSFSVSSPGFGAHSLAHSRGKPSSVLRAISSIKRGEAAFHQPDDTRDSVAGGVLVLQAHDHQTRPLKLSVHLAIRQAHLPIMHTGYPWSTKLSLSMLCTIPSSGKKNLN